MAASRSGLVFPRRRVRRGAGVGSGSSTTSKGALGGGWGGPAPAAPSGPVGRRLRPGSGGSLAGMVTTSPHRLQRALWPTLSAGTVSRVAHVVHWNVRLSTSDSAFRGPVRLGTQWNRTDWATMLRRNSRATAAMRKAMPGLCRTHLTAPSHGRLFLARTDPPLTNRRRSFARAWALG